MGPDLEAIDAVGSTFWTLTRCEHGCYHLNLGRCTIALSPEDLVRLRALLERAVVDVRIPLDHSPAH